MRILDRLSNMFRAFFAPIFDRRLRLQGGPIQIYVEAVLIESGNTSMVRRHGAVELNLSLIPCIHEALEARNVLLYQELRQIVRWVNYEAGYRGFGKKLYLTAYAGDPKGKVIVRKYMGMGVYNVPSSSGTLGELGTAALEKILQDMVVTINVHCTLPVTRRE